MNLRQNTLNLSIKENIINNYFDNYTFAERCIFNVLSSNTGGSSGPPPALGLLPPPPPHIYATASMTKIVPKVNNYIFFYE
jgi:hypothetical protein